MAAGSLVVGMAVQCRYRRTRPAFLGRSPFRQSLEQRNAQDARDGKGGRGRCQDSSPVPSLKRVCWKTHSRWFAHARHFNPPGTAAHTLLVHLCQLSKKVSLGLCAVAAPSVGALEAAACRQ